MSSLLLALILIGLWFVFALFELRRHRIPGSVAFFHPFCNAGGGGEFVLWNAIAALQERYPNAQVFIYTGDRVPAQAILEKAERDFGVHLERAPTFVRLRLRFAMSHPYPRLTLALQSAGGALLALEALWNFAPEVFVDTTGAAFALPIFRWLGGSRTASYVHYPTVSGDMLRAVAERRCADDDGAFVCNSGDVARSPARTALKLAYYRAFARAYGFAGRRSDVVMVNSSWTRAHIAQLWSEYLPRVVYPPCSASDAAGDAPDALKNTEPRIVLSIGQFRPEKRHLMQVKALHRLLLSHEEYWGKVRLVLVGGVRDEEDARRKEEVVQYASRAGLIAAGAVEVPEETTGEQKARLLRHACIGLHTMRDEHFGICVVEYMAHGAVPVAHRSAGPLQDIVVPAADPNSATPPVGAVGFLAQTVEEYAEAMHRLLSDEPLRVRMAALARERAKQFSVENFKAAFVREMQPIM